MKAELEVVRFNTADVIATSGESSTGGCAHKWNASTMRDGVYGDLGTCGDRL